MAGGAGRICLNKQGVAVAVYEHFFDCQVVTAGFALSPKGLAGTGKEGDASFRYGLVEGGAVHISKHQHLKGGGVLYDDGEQSVTGLAKFKVVESHIIQSLKPYRNSGLCKFFLYLCNCVLSIVEDTGSQGRICLADGKDGGDVCHAAGAA